MLVREKHLFGSTPSKHRQGSVPARLTLTSYFGFCFQCQTGSSLVLRRPIETTPVIDTYLLFDPWLRANQYLALHANRTEHAVLGRQWFRVSECFVFTEC
jgi:hypothetical protein